MTNGSEPPTALNFDQSISHNIRWIKQIAEKHDCSSIIAATAALMTMTMMDHHKVNLALDKINSDLEAIRAEVSKRTESQELIRLKEPESEEPPCPQAIWGKDLKGRIGWWIEVGVRDPHPHYHLCQSNS